MVSKFIVIGGIDGSGGTTHCKLLYDWMKENLTEKVYLTKEPSDGRIGTLTREYLKDKNSSPITDALLFAADRSEHVEKVIKPRLEQGYSIISDRYLESSLAYQGAQGLDEQWILTINRCMLNPDITIILQIDPEKSLKRKDILLDKFEHLDILRKVHTCYLELAKKYGYIIINSDREIDTVQNEIRSEIKRLFQID